MACIAADTALVKPPHVLIEKTKLLQEYGVKVQVAVYTDGDIDNAHRYLIKTGLLEKPYYWLILPALPGLSPMHSPKSMAESLLFYVNRIREIDEDCQILVAAAGRAATYLATFAILLGLHIRIGMEDTPWYWPHRDDVIDNNVNCFKMFKTIIEALGREIIEPDEFRELVGMRKRG
jgi:3-keto-5-aminohexanoate cleavage enzyme